MWKLSEPTRVSGILKVSAYLDWGSACYRSLLALAWYGGHLGVAGWSFGLYLLSIKPLALVPACLRIIWRAVLIVGQSRWWQFLSLSTFSPLHFLALATISHVCYPPAFLTDISFALLITHCFPRLASYFLANINPYCTVYALRHLPSSTSPDSKFLLLFRLTCEYSPQTEPPTLCIYMADRTAEHSRLAELLYAVPTWIYPKATHKDTRCQYIMPLYPTSSIVSCYTP